MSPPSEDRRIVGLKITARSSNPAATVCPNFSNTFWDQQSSSLISELSVPCGSHLRWRAALAVPPGSQGFPGQVHGGQRAVHWGLCPERSSVREVCLYDFDLQHRLLVRSRFLRAVYGAALVMQPLNIPQRKAILCWVWFSFLQKRGCSLRSSGGRGAGGFAASESPHQGASGLTFQSPCYPICYSTGPCGLSPCSPNPPPLVFVTPFPVSFAFFSTFLVGHSSTYGTS